MSSNSDGDLPDYITDNSLNEDATLFLPATDGNRDPWTLFFWGILIALAGSVLVPVAPWLAGALIAIGYTLTACTLAGSKRRFARSLALGFTLAAVLGAGLVAVYIYAPKATWHFILVAGNRHLIFPSFALMPWVLGVLKYIHALIARSRRRTAIRLAPGPQRG
jgi:hypothetical protein